MRRTETGLVLVVIIAVALVATLGLWKPGDGTGDASVALTIHYTDGTSKEVEPHMGFFGIYGLQITDDSGKSVSRVDYSVDVRAIFTGSPTSVDYTGSNLIIAVDMVTRKFYGESEFSGMPENGVWVTVASGSITSTQLETWAGTDGEHQLNIGPQVLMKLTWADGHSESKDASMISRWVFNREPDGTFTSLSIQVAHTPLS